MKQFFFFSAELLPILHKGALQSTRYAKEEISMADEKNVPVYLEGEEGHHTKSLIAATLGYAADGMDMFFLSFVLVFIISDFGLTPGQAGNLTLATTLGIWAGSYIFGILADRIGRIKVLAGTIFLYSFATAGIYWCNDYYVLLVLRALVGLGIGGEFGIGMSIVYDKWAQVMCA